jgi:hypothetical protein
MSRTLKVILGILAPVLLTPCLRWSSSISPSSSTACLKSTARLLVFAKAPSYYANHPERLDAGASRAGDVR